MKKYVPDYFAKDFTTIRDELLQRLPVVSEGKITDLNESSVGTTLLELFASTSDMMAFYLDTQALETYLSTVRQPENVYRLSKLIGYVIRETTSAKAYVKFQLPSAHTSEVLIPKDTKLATSVAAGGGLQGLFSTTEPVVIPVGSTESAATLAIQGVQQQETFGMTGSATAIVSLSSSRVDPETVDVYTGKIKWIPQKSFLYSEVEDYHYVVATTYDGVTQVKFGDGKYGRAPANGEQVRVVYIASAGTSGNIGAAALAVVQDTIYDSLGVEVTSVFVSNEEAASGGSAKQTAAQVKATAPGALSALYRAMTKYDYIALIKRLGGVLHVNVWGEQEEAPPSYENMNWVNIVICPEGGGVPSENLKAITREYLDGVQPITVRQRYIDPTYINVDVELTVYVEDGYTVELVRTEVSSAVREYFVLENVRFGLDIRVSEVYKRAMSIDGAAHVSVTKVLGVDTDGVALDAGAPTVGDIVCQKWEIPQLRTISVTGYRATEEPSPDLYPYETID